MTMDRELRSSKRQRFGPTGTDVSVVHSDSTGQVADMRISDSKTYKNVPRMDSADGGEYDDGRKISLEDSKENQRQVRGILSGSQSDVANDVIQASLKTGGSHGSHDGSKDLFPEHNEKLVSTLLSLKETDIPPPKCESFPKARKNQALHSDASAASNHCIDFETHDENSYAHEMQQIELDLLEKLKKYINARGGTIGEGWEVQAKKKNKVIYKAYHSPDGKRFRSMKEIARFVGVLPKKRNPTGTKGDLDSTSASGSRCLIPKGTQLQQITENVEVNQIPRKSVSMAKRSVGQQEVSGPPVTVKDKTKKARPLLESEIQPSIGLLTSGLKEKSTPDIVKESGGGNEMNKRQHMHWTELLELVLKTSDMTVSGIRSQIFKVLASEPPEWVKQSLQPSVATDVLTTTGSGSVKEVILSVLERYRGEETSNKHLPETLSKQPVNGWETGNSDEGIVETESRRKNSDQKALPSSDVITKHCQNVLHDITSAETFAQLCNLIHGSFAGSRTHEVFDFRLIELRMNAGTYGMSPALFDSDIQQNWKRLREIGQEMINLADSLARYSQDSYEKQVSTLLEGEPDVDCNMDRTDSTMRECVNGVAVDKDIPDEQPQGAAGDCNNNKQYNKTTEILRAEADSNPPCISSKNMVDGPSRKVVGFGVKFNDIRGKAHVSGKGTSMENIEDCRNGYLDYEQDDLPNFKELRSSSRQILCTSCSSSERNDCIIFCNKCQNAYHIYCISPPLEAVPRTSWYCSCCSAIRKDSSEVHSLCDGEGTVLKEDTNNAVLGCLTSDLHSGPIEMNNAQENGKVDTSVEQLESESIKKKNEAKASDKVIGIQEDCEHIHLHINQTERVVHANDQESELDGDKRLTLKLCKICSTGTRDDDHLIQCSNENCLYKFYHLRCLRPPLASVPPPTWYCPSCLCRCCFLDENDADIVLCDGCDDAYHTYCLKPPLALIPESNWYCPSCLEKQRRRKRNRTLNSTASGSKSTGRVHSKKASQMVSHDPSDKIVNSSIWHEESQKKTLLYVLDQEIPQNIRAVLNRKMLEKERGNVQNQEDHKFEGFSERLPVDSPFSIRLFLFNWNLLF
ncbi:hypothetical protein SUGI_0978950 [Cryptomeria japonica]|nr:hypothetical protein SUGI_0978950 [Cryptomeria japonica]